MNLIKQQNHYLTALNSKLIVDMQQNELKDRVIKTLAKTYIDCGKVIESKELISLSNGVINEIKRYFINLKIDELDLCFQNGVRKVYGEYFGLNIVTFHQWIKSFMAEEKRLEAIKIRSTPRIEPIKEYTAEDKLRIRDEFMSYAKSTYKKSGHFGLYEPSIGDIYKILVETNEVSNIEFNANIQEAYDYVLEDLEYQSKTNDLLLRRKLIAKIETLTMESKEVINMAKQITIEDLWNK
jgi:hypothetical protein